MLAKFSLVFTMINKLNADQALIQIWRLEKVQHTDSAQRSQTDGPSHGRTSWYALVKYKLYFFDPLPVDALVFLQQPFIVSLAMVPYYSGI